MGKVIPPTVASGCCNPVTAANVARRPKRDLAAFPMVVATRPVPAGVMLSPNVARGAVDAGTVASKADEATFAGIAEADVTALLPGLPGAQALSPGWIVRAIVPFLMDDP